VGNDEFARTLLGNLSAAGVDSRWVTQDTQTPTGIALIVVDDSGQNTIVVASGANMQVTPADVEAALPALAESDTLLLQLEIPLDSIARAVQAAHTHGVRVILNPAPARPLPREMLASMDVLVPNQNEAAFLTGLPARDPDQAAAAAHVLLDYGAPAVVVTLGEQGALLATRDQTTHFPAFPITPVDTTAAGDAFVAGLAVSLSEGRSMAEAIRWGNAAGALAATQLGAQPSLPTRQALSHLLATG
jgi:ribokinase